MGDAYTQHFFDSRGVDGTYAMTFDGTMWTLTRERSDFSPLHFKQPFVGTLNTGGDTIRGRSDTSKDSASASISNASRQS
jgi:hypothetical protein